MLRQTQLCQTQTQLRQTQTELTQTQPRRTQLRGDRRALLRISALVLGVVTLLAVVVAPSAAAHHETGIVSTSGVRGIDFRSVAHEIDGATSAVVVEAVRHGDLDDDGVEEAVVVLSYDTEHGAQWLVQAYAAGTNGTGVEAVGRTYGFTSSWEHFDRLAVRDGTIEFTVRSGAEASRDGWLEVQRWSLVQDELRLLERRSGGTVFTLDSAGPAAPPSFPEWGTRAYLDVGPGGAPRGVVVETHETKSLRVRADDPAAQVRVYEAASGRLAHQVEAGSVVSLAADRHWYIEPVTASDRWTRIELVVADQRALYAPELVVRQFETGDDLEPRRAVSLAWYELSWAHASTDIDLINGLIRGYVDGIRAEHEAAAALCPDGTDATLYVGATPELVSYDLISIRFTIASCLCEQNDEVVEESLVIDLAAGTVMAAPDLVASENIAVQAWWASFVEFQADYFGPLAVAAGTPVDLASVSLTAEGLLVSVAAADVLADAAAEDARWSITEFLAFDDYPGLVDGAIEQRARSGRDVVLPSNGCGC